jgi:catechol 2,3-dioxygenase-like lactoylglutathione lyase family enzyme
VDLGTFSVSLTVKDLAASRAFYEALGFVTFAGSEEHGMVMLRNGSAVVGLFQGMFERNMLTFNPGWGPDCEPLPAFTDVRELQRRLRAAGIEPDVVVDESTTGPGHLVVVDPDGNPVLLDQHV